MIHPDFLPSAVTMWEGSTLCPSDAVRWASWSSELQKVHYFLNVWYSFHLDHQTHVSLTWDQQMKNQNLPKAYCFIFNLSCLSSNYIKDHLNYHYYYYYTLTILHTDNHPQMDIILGPRYVISKVLFSEVTKSEIKEEAQPYNILIVSLLFLKRVTFKTSMVKTCSIKKLW